MTPSRPAPAALLWILLVATICATPAYLSVAQPTPREMAESIGLGGQDGSAESSGDEPSEGEPSESAGDEAGGLLDGEEFEQLEVEEIEARRREVAAAIEAARAEAMAPTRAAPADDADQGEAAAVEPEGPPRISEEQLEELRWLERTYALLGQQLEAARRVDELEGRRDDLEAASDPDALLGIEEPYSFLDLDRLLDRLEAEQERGDLLADTIDDGAAALDAALEQMRQAARERRLLQEQVEKSAGSGREVALRQELETKTQSEKAAEEEAALLRQRLANDRTERELVEARLERLHAAEAWLRERFEPRSEDLDQILAQVEERAAELRQELAGLREQTQTDQSRWLTLQARLEGPGELTPEERAEAEARREIVELSQRRQVLLEGRIDRLERRTELWRYRFELATDEATTEERLREIQSALERMRTDFERDRRLAETRLDELRRIRRRIKERLASTTEGAADEWLRAHLAAVDETADAYDTEIADLDASLALLRRTSAATSPEAGFDLSAFADSAWTGAQEAWDFEITAVDDRPITVGKVVIALLLLIVGFSVSKRLAAALDRLLQSRFGVSSGSAEALQKLVFYVLMVIFFLYALQLVSIPLTVFTVLGGVIAIGVGFGSQNVVNNFISGLILLIERPIKVGDLIDIDGTPGSVERIGLRSVRVRAGDNTHVIVPNSMFLEQKVYNWTITDDLVRSQVDVGVAYGSPVDEVSELMTKAMDDESSIVQSQPKEVMFMEFGDNALLFRAYFWIRVAGYLDTYRIQSRIRFRINRLFQDADIVIAFPQRDLHLDTLAPLQIEMVQGARRLAASTERSADLETRRPPAEDGEPSSEENLSPEALGYEAQKAEEDARRESVEEAEKGSSRDDDQAEETDGEPAKSDGADETDVGRPRGGHL